MPNVYITANAGPFTQLSRTEKWSSASASDWLGRPDLLNANGVWIGIYRIAQYHVYDATSQVFIRFSTDEGRTWTLANTYLDGSTVTNAPFQPHSTNGIGDPLLALCPNGDILLFIGEVESDNTIQGTWQWRSSDGGRSWTDEGLINLNTEIYLDYGVAFNIGTTMYITGRTDPGNNGSPYYNRMYTSTTNGAYASWTQLSEITNLSQNTGEAAVVHTGGNNFLALLRDINTVNKTWLTRSDDLGVTWDTIEDVTSTFATFQKVRMTLHNGRLYAIGRDWGSADERANVLYTSDDLGETWSDAYWFGDYMDDAGYGVIMPRDDGTLYIWMYEGTEYECSVYEYVLQVNS